MNLKYLAIPLALSLAGTSFTTEANAYVVDVSAKGYAGTTTFMLKGDPDFHGSEVWTNIGALTYYQYYSYARWDVYGSNKVPMLDSNTSTRECIFTSPACSISATGNYYSYSQESNATPIYGWHRWEDQDYESPYFAGFTYTYRTVERGTNCYQMTLQQMMTNKGYCYFEQIASDLYFASDPTLLSKYSVVSSVSYAIVPEPATWAMMILGFGLVGGAMRARRKSQLTYSFAN